MDYLAACDGGVRGLRAAWSLDLGFGAVDPEVRALAEPAARRFDELGCPVETVTLDWPFPLEAWNAFFYGGLVGFLAPRLDGVRHRLDPGLAAIVEQCRHDRLVDYVQAQFARSAFWDAVRRLFERYDPS